MHFKKVIKLLSSILIIVAEIMLLPTFLALIWHEDLAFKSFILTAVVQAVFGFVTRLTTWNESLDDISQRDGFLFTVLSWVIVGAFGAIPLVLTRTLPNYSDAFFEVISGLTTTGASRIIDVESCFRSILFWRSLTNWLGGMGIVVLFVAFLPAIGSGAGSFNLMGAETVGPVKSKLTPKTKNTASILWIIYIGITILQIVILLLGRVSLFDAVTITFSTVSTAGFSVKNASIGAYNSVFVEIVVTVFMFLASINFSLYYKILKGNTREALKDTEFRLFACIIFCSSIFGALHLTLTKFYSSFWTALRYMLFTIASVISTTGFFSTQYMLWPSFSILLIFALMFIGGCAGSTGGGIKIVRVYVALKSAVFSIKRKIHPNAVYTLTVDGSIMPEKTITSIYSFIVIYILTWVFSSVVISLSGAGIQDCISSCLLTLGNIGLGFGTETFSEYPHWTNWIFSFLMLSGRLELFTVYVLFSKTFWKR